MALKLTIDPEFESYLEDPAQIPEADLLEAIRDAGNVCLDSIKVWPHDGQSIILDGHRRYRLAEKHPEIQFTTENVELADRAAAYRWIYVFQFSRRNNVPTPAEIRTFRGRWYNTAKKDAKANLHPTGGVPKRQNDGSGETLQKQGSTAKEIAELTGVSASTIERDAAWTASLEKCTQAVQLGIKNKEFKLTNAEVKLLPKLSTIHQDNIANDLRKGIAKNVADAMDKRKIKAPGQKKTNKPAASKPAKGREAPSAAKLVDELTKKHAGYIARGLTAIAEVNGGEGPQFAAANAGLNKMLEALQKMREGKR